MTTRSKIVAGLARTSALMATATALIWGGAFAAAQNSDPCSDTAAFMRTYPLQEPAQPDPCQSAMGTGEIVKPLSTDGWPVWVPLPGNASACWSTAMTSLVVAAGGGDLYQGHAGLSPDVVGFPLNVNLFSQLAIGDFLPPAPTVGESSVCLVSSQIGSRATGWQGISRPTLGGAVDLVSGLPLAQFTDLSLPLPGGEFRLTRTRSHLNRSKDPSVRSWFEQDNSWDWAGDGWMISENPFLLIDSAVPDIVGGNPRTTYLILDAFHSIPFQLLEDSGRYEAPARFQATLTHNGTGWCSGSSPGCPVAQTWTSPPTAYRISLYNGALQYTFAVVREDTPKHTWMDVNEVLQPPSDWHGRPRFGARQQNAYMASRHPGIGMPYYGLCTRIETMNGHVVELDYCGFHQKTLPSTRGMNDFNAGGPIYPHYLVDSTPGCIECQQNCPSKGQLKSATVKFNNEVIWKLFYHFRTAPSWAAAPLSGDIAFVQSTDPSQPQLSVRENPVLPPSSGRRVLNAIYVFKGDPEISGDPVLLSSVAQLCEPAPYNFEHFPRPASTAGDASEPTGAPGSFERRGYGLESLPMIEIEPAGWAYRVRHHYAFDMRDGLMSRIHSRPHLVKTSVDTATSPTGGQSDGGLDSRLTTSSTIIQYHAATPNFPGIPSEVIHQVSAIYDNAAVQAAVKAARDAGRTSGNVQTPNYSKYSAFNENHLAMLSFGETTAGGWPLAELRNVTNRFASVRWSFNDAGPIATTGSDPVGVFVAKYPMGVPVNQLATTDVRANEATKLDVGGNGSDRKYFQIQRLQQYDNASEPLGYGRSVWHVPYRWRAYRWSSTGTEASNETPDFTKARWITIIDEFASATARDDHTYGGIPVLDAWLTKRGQLNRRVVEVSASGVVLRDRTWQFDPDGVSTNGSGLGEEFVYERVPTILSDLGISLPPATPESDPVAHLRNEIVLVEHRSIGWSAANRDGQGETHGFTRFLDYAVGEYDRNPTAPPPTSGWDPDRVIELKVCAEGISQGRVYLAQTALTPGPLPRNTSNIKLYTKQYFWDNFYSDPIQTNQPDRQTVLTFLQPSATKVSKDDLPGPGDQPVDDEQLEWSIADTLTYRNHGDPTVALPSRPVESRMVIGPRRQQRPDGEWYFPVEREWYSPQGSTTWAASGLVYNPITPAPRQEDSEDLQSLTLTRYLRDGFDRPVVTVVDVESATGGPPALSDAMTAHLGEQLPAELSNSGTWNAPDEWSRLPAEGSPSHTPPLNYATVFLYNNPGNALSDVFYPNGRRWASRVITISQEEGLYIREDCIDTGDQEVPNVPEDDICEKVYDNDKLVWNMDPNSDDYPTGTFDYNDAERTMHRSKWFAREYIFTDIERKSDDLYSRMPGEIRDYMGLSTKGAVRKTRRVYFAKVPTGLNDGFGAEEVSLKLGFGPANQPWFVHEAAVEMGFDSAGRIAEANLLEPNSDGALASVGSKAVNELVDQRREKEIDGSISRITRNRLGQQLLGFAGSKDISWTATLQNTTLGEDNDMVLLNRTDYGSGANDAWLPTITRRYTHQPEWTGTMNALFAPPAQDSDGFVTRTTYDWRMRPVIVETFGEASDRNRDPSPGSGVPVMSTSLTIFDHFDRPIIQVSFGRTDEPIDFGGVVANPVSRTAADELATPRPSAFAFIEESRDNPVFPRPLSVVETFYGVDSSVTQRRTYNVESKSQVQFHDEFTLQGRGGTQVYAQRPQQPLSKSHVDGLGRLARARSVVPSPVGSAWNHELARTDLRYDADGNVVDTKRFERVETTSVLDHLVADGLVGSNAVRSRTVDWFDPRKRNVVSADLGTEHAGGKFVAAPAGYVRPVNDGNLSEIKFNVSGGILNLYDPLYEHGTSPNLENSLATVNHFDLLTGRLVATRNPDGSVTKFGYDKAGRLASKIEDAFATPIASSQGALASRRETRYTYKYGRLTKIAATTAVAADGQPTSNDWQETEVRYGAQVFAVTGVLGDRSYEQASFWPSLVGGMSLPDQQFGIAVKQNDITLRYTFDGAIAERIDLRGVAFRYFYDPLGRLEEVVVGRYEPNIDNIYNLSDFVEKHPASMELSSGVPLDRVGYILYTYNDRNQLSDVRSFLHRQDYLAGNAPVAHTQFMYDLRGNLINELQSHGAEILPGSESKVPTVDYEWQYQPTVKTPSIKLGFDRLVSMTYPKHAGIVDDRRIVNLGYGEANSINDVISRLATMATRREDQAAAQTMSVAAFEYIGVGRRNKLDLGHGNAKAVQSFSSGAAGVVGADGLDKFGRVIDLHYKNTSTNTATNTLFRGEYTYSLAGNRLSARLTQAMVGSTQYNGSRSQFSSYNRLGQLTGTDVGQFVAGQNGLPPTIGGAIRTDTWMLDHLGNWTAPATATTGGRFSKGNLDGNNNSQLGSYLYTASMYTPWMSPTTTPEDELRAVSHAVNKQNEITNIGQLKQAVNSAGLPVGSATSSSSQPHYDAAGNLVFDGTYVYQYDAWNRLVQINRAVAGTVGPITGSTPVGPLVKHFTFDGLGRLIRTLSPFPSPDLSMQAADLRSERFYYDGVRRIQEVVLDPTASIGMAMMSGDSEMELAAGAAYAAQSSAADGEVDTSASSMAFENEMMEGEEESSSNSGGSMPMPQIEQHRLEREYIWGPGDGIAGIDELFVMFDRDRAPWLVLQDASGDVAALCSTSQQNNAVIAQVAAQWTWDAYGNVFSADHIAPHPFMRVGHKGLFVERLDTGVADASVPGADYVETPRLVPFARLVYHNRNRSYSPEHGRFLQADPNASGSSLNASVQYYGRATAPGDPLFNMSTRFGDGASLYQYVRSSPWRLSDPLGLYSMEDGYEDATDAMGLLDPLPGPSDFIRSILKAMIDDYSANLDFDVEWASDWSLPDEDHSRTENSWVELAIARGAYEAFDIDLPFTDATFNPLNLFSAEQGEAQQMMGAVVAKKKTASSGGRRGGETPSTKKGKQKHKEFGAGKSRMPGWESEVSVEGVGRLDAMNRSKRIFLELKPNTPSGRALGRVQVAKYEAKLAQTTGQQWKGYAVYYDP